MDSPPLEKVMEARIGADVYNEKMLLDEFLYRSGDTHVAYAKVVFTDELKRRIN